MRFASCKLQFVDLWAASWEAGKLKGHNAEKLGCQKAVKLGGHKIIKSYLPPSFQASRPPSSIYS